MPKCYWEPTRGASPAFRATSTSSAGSTRACPTARVPARDVWSLLRPRTPERALQWSSCASFSGDTITLRVDYTSSPQNLHILFPELGRGLRSRVAMLRRAQFHEADLA